MLNLYELYEFEENVLKGIEMDVKWPKCPFIWLFFLYLVCLFKFGLIILKWFKISPNFTECVMLEQIWLFRISLDWPGWLPMVGHKLAKTPCPKLKTCSPRTWNVLNLVCPWSSAWSLTLSLSCVVNQLYAWRSWSELFLPFPGQWVSYEHSVDCWLFLFSFSLVGLRLPWEEQVQCCHHVLVYKWISLGVRGCGLAVSFITVCGWCTWVVYTNAWYDGWARMCYGVCLYIAVALLLVPDNIHAQYLTLSTG